MARLSALKMQINPHFLFNTLNSISTLVMKKDHDAANEMIDRLSSFFRMTLEETEGQWVPLEKEMQLANEYLAIEQVRFGDRLQVTTHIDLDTRNILVPALILQPLVENAVRHGFVPIASTNATTAALKVESRSKIR